MKVCVTVVSLMLTVYFTYYISADWNVYCEVLLDFPVHGMHSQVLLTQSVGCCTER